MSKKFVIPQGCYIVQGIQSKRVNPDTNQTEYEIKWLGWDEKDNTWEPVQNLSYIKKLIHDFQLNQLNNNRRSRKIKPKLKPKGKPDRTKRVSDSRKRTTLRKTIKKNNHRSLLDNGVKIEDQTNNTPSKQVQLSPLSAQIQQQPFKDPNTIQTNSNNEEFVASSHLDLPSDSEQSGTKLNFSYPTRSRTPLQVNRSLRPVQQPEVEFISKDEGGPFNFQSLASGKVQIIDTWYKKETFFYKVKQTGKNNEAIWINKSVFQQYCPQILTNFLWKDM